MPLLYYWRGDNHRRDLDFGAGYHLNQASPVLHQIEIGDSLWAFTRRSDGVYVIAAELVVSAKTMNPKGYRYGPYRIWGDLRASRYFDVQGQPDITWLIRRLSVSARGDVLGRAFQGRAAVRRLSVEDHQYLYSYSGALMKDPRARLLPEERLEALLLSGDEEAVAALLRDEPAGLAEERRHYLLSQARLRSRTRVAELSELYRGRCQVCCWSAQPTFPFHVGEAHHVRWVSRGGADALSNLVLLCPNHHRIIHRADAQLDFGRMAFLSSGARLPLELLEHELAA